MTNLHTYIEHTLLKPTSTVKDIVKLCDEAKQYDFYGVCVNSCYALLASTELKDHPSKVIATIGFPLGASSTKAKVAEAKQAIKDGADVSKEIRAIKTAIDRRQLKVIIETCYLDESEILMACEIVRLAGADFVKTSTGFGDKGAQLKDVELIRNKVEGQLGIKASGGIKTANQAIAFIVAGATRIGTSNGVSIVYDPKNHD